jgi:hypothetical protein
VVVIQKKEFKLCFHVRRPIRFTLHTSIAFIVGATTALLFISEY